MSNIQKKLFLATQRKGQQALLFLVSLFFVGCRHRIILLPAPAPQPASPSLVLLAKPGEFRLKVIGSSTKDYLMRLHPSDISYILKDSNNNIVSPNPGYKRSSPDDADWRLLQRGTIVSLPISPAADYSGLEDGDYILKAKLNPVDSMPTTLKKRFKSYSVWIGPPQESNEIAISVKGGRWR